MKKTQNPTSTKDGFLNFPKDEYCTTCLSIAPPASGKTFIMLECLKIWVKNKMFDEFVVVLPSYKNEMSGSYEWLEPLQNVFVHEAYNDIIGQELVEKQKKNHALFKAKKIKQMPRVFFCVDDASSEKNLFQSDSILSLVTKNRHLNVHSWFLLHADKGVIPPAVRQNIHYVFIYKLKDNFLQHVFKEYVNFSVDFDDYRKDFKQFFKDFVIPHQFGCLLIGGSRDYSPNVHEWFADSK